MPCRSTGSHTNRIYSWYILVSVEVGQARVGPISRVGHKAFPDWIIDDVVRFLSQRLLRVDGLGMKTWSPHPVSDGLFAGRGNAA